MAGAGVSGSMVYGHRLLDAAAADGVGATTIAARSGDFGTGLWEILAGLLVGREAGVGAGRFCPTG